MEISVVPFKKRIGASTGSNPCSGVCGPYNCRTPEACGRAYEEIPESKIIIAIGMSLKERGRG